MRQKRNMFQTKEQDKTPEKQLSEVHTGNLPEKGFQVKESKDDPRTWERMSAQWEVAKGF